MRIKITDKGEHAIYGSTGQKITGVVESIITQDVEDFHNRRFRVCLEINPEAVGAARIENKKLRLVNGEEIEVNRYYHINGNVKVFFTIQIHEDEA